MLLAGPPSARADQNNWHARFYCDVLFRGLSLCGLRKQKALCCNQHSQRAETCLMQAWNAPHYHCQKEKEKPTTVVSAATEGGPQSPLFASLNVILEMHRGFTEPVFERPPEIPRFVVIFHWRDCSDEKKKEGNWDLQEIKMFDHHFK